MSDDGERTCPLCLEDMDLTDQQLKPCKCGYEICLLCWHHINEMAEKEGTEGRCPGCRTPYDKERIVAMAAESERIISEVNAAKKQKSQKAKTKASPEAKKHLSSVRVIQRNLVYIIGLPSSLCDESILERKEYFGQYGKVLKVSVSRPSGTTSQQTVNDNTFSVYITYAKEEEAVRCIQAVHNYVLDGKTLRACFGTTKYCHAWLKNMSCSNPDCLYLHDTGSQEDSFTKDEIISAYTRTRVPQIASNSSLRRGGNVLPPPVDDFNSAKNQLKSILNSTSSQPKGSPPANSASKSTMLPAAASWGLRGANCRPAAAGVAGSQISSGKHKVDTNNHSSLPSSLAEITKQPSPWNDEVDSTPKGPVSRTHTVANTLMPSLLTESSKQSSAWHDEVVSKSNLMESRDGMQLSGNSRLREKLASWKDSPLSGSSQVTLDANYASRSAWNDDTDVRSRVDEETCMPNLDSRPRTVDLLRPSTEKKSRSSVSDVTVDISEVPYTLDSSSSCIPSLVNTSKDKERGISMDANNIIQICNPVAEVLEQQSNVIQSSTTIEESIQSLCLGMSSLNADSHDRDDKLNVQQHLTSSTTPSSKIPGSRDSSPALVSLSKGSLFVDEECNSELTDSSTRPLKTGLISESYGVGDHALHFHKSILRLPDSTSLLSSSPCVNHSNSAMTLTSMSRNGFGCDLSSFVDQDMNEVLSPSRVTESALSNGHMEDELNSFCGPSKVVEYPELSYIEEKVKSSGRVDNMAKHNKSASIDIAGESSIIADILSLDFDPWDDSLFAADNFARLLGETDKQERLTSLSNSWKSQSSNQSRFSFARQESQVNALEPPGNEKSHAQNYFSSQNGYNNEFHNVALFNTFESSNSTANGSRILSSDMSTGMTKAKVAAPPGFSAPSRTPPPGFSSQDRFNQTYETTYSGNHPLGSSSVGNHYQSHLVGNSGDIEFMDPAILAVGKGRMPLGVNNSGSGLKSVFPAQFSTSDVDPRLHLLMQQSISSHQNLRIPDHMGNRFMQLNDAYITSRLLSQNHSNISPFAQMSVQQQRNLHFTNSQCDGWNDFRTGSDIGISEILRNERFGLNNYYSGNEEHTFHVPNSDVYNRAFGM